ncbi:MAG: DUF421 domain-containing protein [Clostridia bacterium]|nr:DUF421 domain-containing protein [Clostridia bacterium]
MLHAIVRSLVVYFFVLVAMRFMGKREIGNLSPFDLVVAIMIAELGAIPLQNHDIPLGHGLVPIGILAAVEVLVAATCLKCPGIRKIVIGEPTVIVEDGKLMEGNMRKLRYNINDLMTQLRDKDVFDVADVESAFLEPSGRLSVLLKSQKRPVTPEDLSMATDYEGPAYPLVADGRIQYHYLKMVDLTVKQLKDRLEQKDVHDLSDVFLASISSDGELYVTLKNEISLDELERGQ